MRIPVTQTLSFSEEEALEQAASLAIRQSLRVCPGERVLLISNPDAEVLPIALALFRQVQLAGGRPNLVLQPAKTQLDDMDPAVLAALKTRPEVYISISRQKIGRDPEGRLNPYQAGGKLFDSITSWLIYGLGCTRGFWSPGISLPLFAQTVPVDFAALSAACTALKVRLDRADRVHLTAPGGTDLRFSVAGRLARLDDGDYSRPGSGGNLPAGESFISPVNGTAEGTLVFDGSMSTKDGTVLCRTPIVTVWENGYLGRIEGGSEAALLVQTITQAEQQAREAEAAGRLPPGQGAVYARNARHLGELGIGANPLAGITGNMLVDEKALGTCHLAIGANYDHDAPAFIHLDGVVRQPTLVLFDGQGKPDTLLREGVLVPGA